MTVSQMNFVTNDEPYDLICGKLNRNCDRPKCAWDNVSVKHTLHTFCLRCESVIFHRLDLIIGGPNVGPETRPQALAGLSYREVFHFGHIPNIMRLVVCGKTPLAHCHWLVLSAHAHTRTQAQQYTHTFTQSNASIQIWCLYTYRYSHITSIRIEREESEEQALKL